MRALWFVSLFLPALKCVAVPFTPFLRCPGDWTLEGEWIYFAPTSESKFLGIEAGVDSNPEGERFGNFLNNYTSGYRVSAVYTPKELSFYLGATWSSLAASNNFTYALGGNGFLATALPPGLIGELELVSPVFHDLDDLRDFSFQSADLIIGLSLFEGNCGEIDLFVGLQYARLKSKESYLYENSATTFIQGVEKSSFWGVGPELGVHLQRPLWYGISLCGSLGSALLIGKPTSSVHIDSTVTGTPGFGVNATNRSLWHVVPTVDIQLNLCYNFCFPCELFERYLEWGLRGSLQVGYEILSYFDGLSSMQFTDTSSLGTSLDLYRDATLHGPIVSLSLSF